MFFDPLYLLFALPGLLLALFASFLTKTTFNKYSKVESSNRMSGAQAAQRLLASARINDVKIEQVSGFLSDHYDPISKTLRLSSDVYNSTSLSAIGVACHEAGHAIQHKVGYAWLTLRSTLVPATNVASYLSYFVIIIGSILQATNFILLGALIFSIAVVFSIITLPVEWDASKRAKQLMVQSGIIPSFEVEGASKVLNAAFLTYVAAAVSSLLTLLYYLMRAGIFGRSDD